MNRPAAKEKRRSSERSRGYLKTRIRASRLLAAAHVLAFIELSRRLHQAYRQAYDKQVAEWLLPQNSGQQQNPLKGVTGGASGAIDPCAGVKASDLDYSQEHFTERHILNADPNYAGRSKYVFNLGIGSRIMSEPDPNKRLQIAQQAVKDYDTFTFNQGGRYQQSPAANIVFVYGFPRASGPGVDVEWFVGVMGKDQPHAGELTNVNTLVLDRNCRTVITSYPGLPNSAYNFGGTPPYYGKR